MEDANNEAEPEPEEKRHIDPNATPSLTAQCCAFVRMKSYAELTREWKVMEEAPATESSSAGKMRRRSSGRLKSWVDVMAGRDYLG